MFQPITDTYLALVNSCQHCAKSAPKGDGAFIKEKERSPSDWLMNDINS